MGKRGQAEVIKYLFVAFIVLAIAFAGFRAMGMIKQKACDADLAEFQLMMTDMERGLRSGAVEDRSIKIPCKADKLILLDTIRGFPDPGTFAGYPQIQDSIRSRAQENAFLIREDEIIDSFDAGNLDLPYPDSLCLLSGLNKVDLRVESKGSSVSLSPVCEQRVCGSYAETFSRQKTEQVIQKGNRFDQDASETCYGCPRNPPENMIEAEATMDLLTIERSFTVCQGKTTVQLTVTPEEGVSFRDLAVLESLSPECSQDFQQDLQSYDDAIADRTSVYTKEPMLVWLFGDLEGSTTVSYTMSDQLSDQCRQDIAATAFASEADRFT